MSPSYLRQDRGSLGRAAAAWPPPSLNEGWVRIPRRLLFVDTTTSSTLLHGTVAVAERRLPLADVSYCVPDIAMVDAHGEPTALIEVHHTHAPEGSLIAARERGIPLFVVSAPADWMLEPGFAPSEADDHTDVDRALREAADAFYRSPGSDVDRRFSYSTVADGDGCLASGRLTPARRPVGAKAFRPAVALSKSVPYQRVDHRTGEASERGSVVAGEGDAHVARASLHTRALGFVGIVPHRRVEPQEAAPDRLVPEPRAEVEEQPTPQSAGATLCAAPSRPAAPCCRSVRPWPSTARWPSTSWARCCLWSRRSAN